MDDEERFDGIKSFYDRFQYIPIPDGKWLLDQLEKAWELNKHLDEYTEDLLLDKSIR